MLDGLQHVPETRLGIEKVVQAKHGRDCPVLEARGKRPEYIWAGVCARRKPRAFPEIKLLEFVRPGAAHTTQAPPRLVELFPAHIQTHDGLDTGVDPFTNIAPSTTPQIQERRTLPIRDDKVPLLGIMELFQLEERPLRPFASRGRFRMCIVMRFHAD